MDNTPKELKGELYPLAEHFLAIFDTQNPIETLREEVERFESCLETICREFEEKYGEENPYPADRPPETWTKRDENFVQLDYRWRLLNRTHVALLKEMELLKTLSEGHGIRSLVEILVSAFEQLDELPCPYYEKKPENGFIIRMFPPLQRLTLETIKILGKSAEPSTAEKLKVVYLYQHAFLRNLRAGWTSEFGPIKTTAYFSYDEHITDDWWMVKIRN